MKQYSEEEIPKGTKSSDQIAMTFRISYCVSLLSDGQAQHILFVTFLNLYTASSQDNDSQVLFFEYLIFQNEIPAKSQNDVQITRVKYFNHHFVVAYRPTKKRDYSACYEKLDGNFHP